MPREGSLQARYTELATRGVVVDGDRLRPETCRFAHNFSRGTAVSLAGAAGAYVARRILTGAEMPSGRYSLSLDAALDPLWHSPAETQLRMALTTSFEQRVGLVATANEAG